MYENYEFEYLEGLVSNSIDGNEKADELAKAGCQENERIPCKPGKSEVKSKLKEECRNKWNQRWETRERPGGGSYGAQTRIWFPHLRPKQTADLLKLPRETLGRCIQYITGFGNFNGHSNCKDESIDYTCRLCEDGPETPTHLTLECEALAVKNLEIMPTFHSTGGGDWTVSELVNFLEIPGVWTVMENRTTN